MVCNKRCCIKQKKNKKNTISNKNKNKKNKKNNNLISSKNKSKCNKNTYLIVSKTQIIVQIIIIMIMTYKDKI